MSIEHLMNIKSTQNATFTIRICNSFIIFLKKIMAHLHMIYQVLFDKCIFTNVIYD